MKMHAPLAAGIALALTLAVGFACNGGVDTGAAADADHRLEESNRSVVRGYVDRLVNAGDWEAWPELIADETVTFNGRLMSREEVIRMWETFRGILPDMRVTVEEQIAENDVVASRVTITGTHLGDYMGLEASGQEVAFGGITYDRLRDGRIVEVWHQMDLWGALLMASDD